MRLLRLEIIGFKSFNDRVVIGFDDGITGIVGPNGCGKSNVVDAIRWAMGEQSAKHLRGRSMEDVIFAGSEREGPGGLAEVALTLQNDRPAELPPLWRGFAEITVQRRLFRSGESEYLINKTPCRLLDVTELFLGTGVGTRAYSIIEQGRIGLILNSKPEERRAILEEAAGITRFKSRKRAAERKMEHTEQNLLRLGDIVDELKKRLDQLERQARKAERYRKLKDELREIELHVASVRWLELAATAAHLRRELGAFAERETQAAMAIGELEGAMAETREQLAVADRRLEELAGRVHGLDKELAQTVQSADFAAREQERLAGRAVEVAREAQVVDERVHGFEQEQGALGERRRVLDAEIEEGRGRVVEAERAVQALDEEKARLAEQLSSDRRSAAEAASRAAGAERSLAHAGERLAELAKRLAAVGDELAGLEAARRRAEETRAAHVAELDGSRQLELALKALRGQTELSLGEARAALSAAEAEGAASREELALARSRLASLEELRKNFEGCEAGARAVMLGRQDGGGRVPGVLGLVADLLTVPRAIEVAVEAVLGERLQQVVVESREDAVAAARWLAASAAGRGVFLPLASAEGEAAPAPAAEHPGVVGAAVDLVEVAPEHRAVAELLLGDVLVVRDLEAALELSAGGWTLVTLRGEVLWPSGAVAGGTLEGRGAGELSKRREIAELGNQLRALETRALEIEARRGNLAALVRQLEGDLETVAKDSHVEAVKVAHREKDAHAAEAEMARAVSRLAEVEAERADLIGLEARLLEERQALQAALAASEVERAEVSARVAALEAALSEVGRRDKAAAEERTGLQIKLASELERREALALEEARLGQSLEEARARLTELSEERRRGAERHGELGVELERCRVASALLQTQLAELRDSRENVVTERAAAQAFAAKLEAALAEERRGLSTIRDDISGLHVREREQTLELTHLARTIADRHAVDLLLELPRFHALPPPPKEREERLAELRESLARMGEINLTAIQEHREVAERHELLARQRADLERSLVHLREAIGRMNRTSRQRFRETFDLVNERFSQVFPRLFNGGRAELQLVEEGGDLLEAGVEIVAQPPGKRLQSIGLLSGGEKALTAIALVFAIFLIKPSPFCLLDEVDAPLDEANVGRYNDLVREMSKISQFILITHNKRTMEVADTLYGVTMEEPGCSKLVSVKLTDRRAASAA
ncbi:MAG TPA: chromosome segregation protein SMC [Myxococcales bacterium]|nr:chromosome segregation protein SMC [Myxococcales bacterium]